MLKMIFRNRFFYFLFVAYSLLCLKAKAQKGVLMGKIIDKQTQEALIGADIAIESTAAIATTEIDGSFLITEIEPGVFNLNISYVTYLSQTITNISIQANDTVYLNIALEPEITNLGAVTITAKANRESETVLLSDQKKSIASIQSIGAAELSRKGIGDASTALLTISGISKQEGVKNVIIRGLGDRYNVSLLNGLPIPSEDPEFKNISLSFFESDIIKNIQVDKVFPMHHTSDVGGAIIDIHSKEINKDYELNIGLGLKINNRAIQEPFMKTDGFNFWGMANKSKPNNDDFSFINSLDPKQINIPLNESFHISGGKKWNLGTNSLSIFGVATHSSDFTFSEEQVRNATTDGTVYQDQIGKKYTGKKNQLILTNLNYNHNKMHELSYNFMLLHAGSQYIGEYKGKHSEKFQDASNEIGFIRRQQVNDNTLMTHQLLSKWKLGSNWLLNTKFSFNQIFAYEPDRRENYLSQLEDGTYRLTGSNRQKRFFSNLLGQDFNTQVSFEYLLKDKNNSGHSKLIFGYSNQIGNTGFEAEEYNFSAVAGTLNIESISLDQFYNKENYNKEQFEIAQTYPSSYTVEKNYHSVFLSGIYQFSNSFSAIAGFKLDQVNLGIQYDVPGQTGLNEIAKLYYLPNLNLRYNWNEKNSLRLGLSKTYTLPQSKEISPFQYINIGFASEGNPHLKPSDNYNLDLKWDYYLSASEVMTAGIFYKKILNPIGRVDKGNSAGLLTYDNISNAATAMGVEVELRKNIFKLQNEILGYERKLSLGMNASYIFTQTQLALINTPSRLSSLEGAAPFLFNADVSYFYTHPKLSFNTALVFNYVSDKVHTIGTMGYNDIIEKSVTTLDFVVSTQLFKRVSLKLKLGNILNPVFTLTRNVGNSNHSIILNQYRKGIDAGLGITFKL